MDGWSVMIAAGICACGMLSFLRTVALAVDEVNANIEGKEVRRQKERKSSAAA